MGSGGLTATGLIGPATRDPVGNGASRDGELMDCESAPYDGNNVTVGSDGWVTWVAGRGGKREEGEEKSR